ncbi:MAG TPA: sigma-70 family RNA polymerase sigma factor [Sphingobacterium sp.]|nr:sigma-70 family RNA polymerase sigma factor [Sphingobacterium sp.]
MTQHPKNISDEEFVAFQNGDARVFRIVFDKYQATLCRFAYSVCKDEDITQDAVQESFVKLYQNKSKIDAPGAIYPLLFVITKRYLLRVFRRSVIEAKYKHELSNSWSEGSTATIDQLRRNDLGSILDELVHQLPDKQKQIFLLNKFGGYSYEEISDQTGTSKNTIKNQVVTATKKIRLQLYRLYPFYFLLFFLNQ